jgi:hypothetical protein
MALSERWTQPIQQQGRRLPSFNSVTVRLIWFFLVSGFLTVILQHIHSLRAIGVMSSHAARALESELRDFRKSAGNLCAVPPEIFLSIHIYYQPALIGAPRTIVTISKIVLRYF